MQMVDVECRLCGAQTEALRRDTGFIDRCSCGGERERVYKIEAALAVQPDSIPGGEWFKHGICNEDGTPKRYDKRSDIRKALKDAGLVPLETEIPVYNAEIEQNLKRTGQSKRPLACSGVLNAQDEAERVRLWHATENTLQRELAAEKARRDALTSEELAREDERNQRGQQMLDYLR